MLKASTLILAAAALLSAQVRGHGYVQQIVTDGVTYSGYLPYEFPYENPVPECIVRSIPSNGTSVSTALYNFLMIHFLRNSRTRDRSYFDRVRLCDLRHINAES